MNYEIFDLNTIILGLLATCLFAECIILIVRVNSLRNKMEAEAEAIRADEKIKYEKKSNELEMMLKEKELEIKAEYEDMLTLAKIARREQDEKLAAAKTEFERAKEMSRKASQEFSRLEQTKRSCKAIADEYAVKLANIAGLNRDAILSEARAEMNRKCAEDLQIYKSEILDSSKKELDQKARLILSESMQRMSADVSREASNSIVKIPDEAMKGRLIGKDGRNIRAFESAAEVTLVIDESPDTVMLSSFNPRRRRIAKLALEALVKDGRINPSSIEQALKDAAAKAEEEFSEIGMNAFQTLGLPRPSDEILRAIGSLGEHLSLNQDTLLHSMETATLCGFIAAEIGCDTVMARRAGLLHDIGKTMSDTGMSHAAAGAAFLAAHGESDILVNAVAAHHGEVEASSAYAAIVRVADSLSATRPGARMEATDGYIRRIKTLENIALGFGGVSSAYVLQAGRELRVIVSPESMDDVGAAAIAREIRQAVEKSTGNSIPVKITLIRESRFVEVARVPDSK